MEPATELPSNENLIEEHKRLSEQEEDSKSGDP